MGLARFCLAGGCALNVIANKKIREIGYLDQVYIQPASNDSGIALILRSLYDVFRIRLQNQSIKECLLRPTI